MFCDNDSVVTSTSFPESSLKKKHCFVAYHNVRESLAAGLLLIYYEHTKSNIEDLFTKVLPENDRQDLIQAVLN